MTAYILRRLLATIPVMVVVAVFVFFLLRLAPGDPAAIIAGEDATADQIAAVHHKLGLDRPILEQFVVWIAGMLQGDFGTSIFSNLPVSRLILQRLEPTVSLTLSTLLVAVCLAIPLGVLAAVRPNSFADRFALTLAVIGQAMPSFWFALTLILWLGVVWRLLPITGSDSWQNFVMPAIALGYYVTPAVMRLTRAGVIEVLSSDYIRTARAKGLRPMTVLFKHALRNAIIPVVSLTAVQFGFMLGGSIVIETIFQINGLGYLAWESIQRKDLPTMQAIVLVLSVIYVLLTLLADLLNAFLDPRLRVA